MSNSPAPPVCAPRTKRPPAVSSPPSDNLSNQSQATTSRHSNSSPAGSSCTSRKVKSTHPWLSILHPGPWNLLPPAPSPLVPPGSSSLLAKNKGWFKARVTPPNPFEEADKDANSTAGQRASQKPAHQSEPTSSSRDDSSPPEEESDVAVKPSSRVNPNAAIVSASLFDEPASSETPPCEDPPPPAAQTEGAAVSSSGLSEINQASPGESPAAAAAGLPEGLGNTPKSAQPVGLAGGFGVPDMAPTSKDWSSAPGSGSVTKEGPLSGPVEGAPDSAGHATSMERSHMSALRSLSGDDHLSGRAEGGHPPGSLEVIGVPDLVPESGSPGTTATSVVPPDLTSSVGAGGSADAGSRPGGPGGPDVGESPAVGGSVEAGAAPGLSSMPKSFSVPAIFHALKKGMTSLSQSETSGADQEPVPVPAVPKSHSMHPLSRRPAAPGYGFPLIKRTVRTDACVPADDLKGELGEVNKRLEELELCGVQLERNLRDCKNKYKENEEEAMLADWMALIQEKQTLLRREAEITHLARQKTLEERHADLEYKLRCLLIKPESEWSAEDEAQEQKMLDDLVAVIEQRNQIISSLDEERHREKEEDSVLKAMQEKELQKKGLKELKKSKGKFQSMKVFRMLSVQAAQESTRESKDKKN